MRVALIVGHARDDKGAVNERMGINEFDFNDQLVHSIVARLEAVARNITPLIIYRNTYERLPQDVNDTGADIAIEFHCNAYNTLVSGTETLYFHDNAMGAKLAEALQRAMVGALGLRDRGTEPRRANDRGGHLLAGTTMPCVIVEPFFIDRDADVLRANELFDDLVEAFIDALVEWAA